MTSFPLDKSFFLDLNNKLHIAFLMGLIIFGAHKLPAQPLQNKLINPVFDMRDGAVEKFMGQYYVFGTGTKGKMSSSKNLTHWTAPVVAIRTNEATWLNNPKWTQASAYGEIGAGDMIYRNGVFHAYWNGIGHAYAATPMGPYKESTISEPFDDYGIDVQVFQDEDGEAYWVKKRNPSDPHPMTGAPSNISGPEVWTFKMANVFTRKNVQAASVQLTHQPGHPTSVNHINFEGPELFKYRNQYYLMFVSNRMGPRSAMYETGVAVSDSPMNFNNSKKYPHPIMFRNTEQHILEYKTLMNSAEHGGWDCVYLTREPQGNWMDLQYEDQSWSPTQGGFGRQEYDLFAGVTFTNAKNRPRKTVWNTPKLFVRRKFTISEIPANLSLKHWVFADADFYINGHKVSINARDNTYRYTSIDPSLLQTGENIIAVEAASPCSDANCQQFLDFGLYDTADRVAENIVIGQSQPNYIEGPNGFEHWIMYKAYFNAVEKQGVDRVHFYNKEMVVESSSVLNTKGYRPVPALPSWINYCDYPIYYPFKFLNETVWKISGGVLYPEDSSGGELLLYKKKEQNYRFEVPFRIKGNNGSAGVYAYYQDEDNWLKVQINKHKTWELRQCVAGAVTSQLKDLPAKFAFLDDNALVQNFDEPWHTLVIYKNNNQFKITLDYFNLTLDGNIETSFHGAGDVGLYANSNEVSFDAIQYTTGWDEYDDKITGWETQSGKWTVGKNGLLQSDVTGKSSTLKGDSAWNYDFSVYVKNNQLPSSGKLGFYPLYVDEENFVQATIDYAGKTLDIVAKEDGRITENQSLSLKKQALRYYTLENYPTTSYRYDLRNEALVSGVNILWFEGNYPYLNQNFDLPASVSFYALQGGAWVQLNSQLEGELRFSEMNHFTFPPTKTTAIKMEVTNRLGKFARAYAAYFDEDIAAGYYLRARREADSLHIFIDDTYKTAIVGNWKSSRVGLLTENIPAIFNGMLHYQSGKVPVTAIEITPAACQLGEVVQLQYSVFPIDATHPLLRWESSDPSVVSVDDDGQIIRHKEGNVKIKAFSADGGYVQAAIDLLPSKVDNLSQTSAFRIISNPVYNRELRYETNADVHSISIFSVSGTKLLTCMPDESGILQLNQLTSGMYILCATTANGQYTDRFTLINQVN